MKKRLLPLLATFLFFACQKQAITDQSFKPIESAFSPSRLGEINVCHKDGTGAWHSIKINVAALATHLAHGDIVPDEDGDGYTKPNQCGLGNQDDCNDTNANINPGAENCYLSVAICNQVWMIKNLDVTTYRNGEVIPEVTDPSAWAALTTGAWCYYANNTSNGTTYDKLYNWYAVNDPRGLAPTGWHVPGTEEWTTLENCLGGASVAGAKMKTTGTVEGGTGLWYSPNSGATNSSGFTGLPGGFRYSNGPFLNIQYAGIFWTSTEYSTTGAWNRYLAYDNESLTTVADVIKGFGFSIRCVKD